MIDSPTILLSTFAVRELQNKYNLDDDSLLEKYVAYRSNKKLGNVVELHHVESFEKEVIIFFIFSPLPSDEYKCSFSELG